MYNNRSNFTYLYLDQLDDEESHKKDVESDSSDSIRDITPIAGIKVGQLRNCMHDASYPLIVLCNNCFLLTINSSQQTL